MELGSNYDGVSHRDSSFPTARGGYEYDPALDETDPGMEEDLLHDPRKGKARQTTFPWRGIGKVAILLPLASGLLNPSLRVQPVFMYFQSQQPNNVIDEYNYELS